MKENHQTNKPLETDEEIKKIEDILGIKPGQDHEKSDYLTTLKLNDVTIDDFSKFLPYLSKVGRVDLTNCIIPSFSDLLKLDHCSYFYLDNVTFKNNGSNIIRDFPHDVRFSNMSFDACCLNGMQASGSTKIFRHLFIKNCHIDNIQELSNIGGLYSLELDKITFTCHSKKIKEKSISMIDVSNSQFDDISFIPFKKSVRNIDFKNCRIGSFEGISGFEKLGEMEIDSDTIVEDTEGQENPFNKEMICSFVKGEKPFSLRNVLSLRNYINELHFTGFKEKTIDDLGKFEKLTSLSLGKSILYVDAFLPIARQIRKIELRDSVIKKHTYFKHFSNLTGFELACFEKENADVRSFLKLLPLKKQLKELVFYERDELRNRLKTYPVGQFTALESLKIGFEVSAQTVESILTLKKLKRLYVSIKKTKQTFDIGRLKKLEFLTLILADISTKVRFTGFEHLKRLQSLGIISDRKFDLKTLPKMKSLKRLSASGYDCHIKGMNRFPNLEFLKLHGAMKLELKTLKKLKVLDLQNSEIKDFSSFEIQPSLEKLDLSGLQGKINLERISKFPNLKWLTLLESYEVDDISGLEPLKKLERLDLYRTKVTDIRVLNTLPDLKEVNIAVSNYGELNLESQLDRPEIAIYSGLPLRNLSIWKKDKFGI
ncbi:hypothetical protein [Chryseobacterium sp. 2987]|uniref:hypothetical protein n=1 Tax=Chryseobacterium sp. 2987 TaxID=2817767 RepID=UPI002856CB52|nr:hypothetical protein [Chryseobacterium sp. 2987]MDR6920178.1 Leucine-rich repeat (LRR) protein [Chryseobacterium sp. 2987]